MLRKLLLSTALVAAAGSAVAADLPYRTAAPAPYVAAAPIFTWTGFYVGLNAGGASNNGSRRLNDFGFNPGAGILFADNNDDVSFTGGVTAGYNMQFGSIVAGVEADLNYLHRRDGLFGDATVVGQVNPANDGFYTARLDNSNKWFGTVRGRLGFAFDRALIFATGGIAFGGKMGGATGTFTDAGGTTFTTTSTGGNGDNIGWALGAGMEYAFTNSISLKVEYLHVDLGSTTRTLTVPAAAGGTVRGLEGRQSNQFDIVRAGLNFRF